MITNWKRSLISCVAAMALAAFVPQQADAQHHHHGGGHYGGGHYGGGHYGGGLYSGHHHHSTGHLHLGYARLLTRIAKKLQKSSVLVGED